MLRHLVAADDRTGAFEVAAWLAGDGMPSTVWVGDAGGDGVVDIGTRHCPPVDAAERVRALPLAMWRAHKTDSLLRGNWPVELRALGARVLFVPAWPEMGRVCVHGVVQADGRVVGAVRDHLPEATVLHDPTSVGAWLQGGRGIAVADAQTTERMVEVVEAASGVDDVVVAGPAGPVGAAFRARFGAMAAAPVPRPDGAVLVVNGSASQAAHEQLRRLRATRPDVEVVSVPEGGLDLRPGVARAVVTRAAQSAASAAVVVLIGGDTAAAFLGDEPRRVGGFAAPGMPWSLDARDGGPLVITKAGAFGGPDALSDVLRRLAD